MLDNKYALLFIRGERPILDLKYDILKHPNVGLTTDGHGEPYIHGFSEYSVGNLTCSKSSQSETENVNETTDEDANYIIYSSEEIEDFLMNYKEEESNEE